MKIRMLTEARAINTGTEEVTVPLIKQVCEDSLQFIQPIIAALQHGDEDALLKYDDLLYNGLDENFLVAFERETNKRNQKPSSNRPKKTNDATKKTGRGRKGKSRSKTREMKSRIKEMPADDMRELTSSATEEVSAHEILSKNKIIKSPEDDSA